MLHNLRCIFISGLVKLKLPCAEHRFGKFTYIVSIFDLCLPTNSKRKRDLGVSERYLVAHRLYQYLFHAVRLQLKKLWQVQNLAHFEPRDFFFTFDLQNKGLLATMRMHT